MELKRGGIKPECVVFMSYGIQIGKDIENHLEVKKNFVIFYGKTFLEKIKEFYEPDSEEVAECNEGTVEGFRTCPE
jgi:hypothetical protein